jgi:hypothetical protein
MQNRQERPETDLSSPRPSQLRTVQRSFRFSLQGDLSNNPDKVRRVPETHSASLSVPLSFQAVAISPMSPQPGVLERRMASRILPFEQFSWGDLLNRTTGYITEVARLMERCKHDGTAQSKLEVPAATNANGVIRDA